MSRCVTVADYQYERHICSAIGGKGYCLDVTIRVADDGSHTVVEPGNIPKAVVEYVRELGEQERRRRVAEARAKEMLVRLLTDEQRETFTRSGYIDVTGSAGGNYRINCGTSYSGNIALPRSDGGTKRGMYCAHPSDRGPRGWLPLHDMFLGQMLLITTDEPTFLDVAVFYR